MASTTYKYPHLISEKAKLTDVYRKGQQVVLMLKCFFKFELIVERLLQVIDFQ